MCVEVQRAIETNTHRHTTSDENSKVICTFSVMNGSYILTTMWRLHLFRAALVGHHRDLAVSSRVPVFPLRVGARAYCPATPDFG